MIKGFVLGIVAALVLFAAFGYFGVQQGWMPANADGPPLPLEAWAARRSLRATIRKEAPTAPNPVALSDANLEAGIKLYGQNCVVCHGAAGGQASNIAVGLYQHAPQLGKDGVEDDPEGVTYWKVKHGIRFTGMPAFASTFDETQIWQIALFLKHMDSLPKTPNAAWHALQNPTAIAPEALQPKERD